VARSQCRISALGEAIVERKYIVFGGFGHEAILQVSELLGLPLHHVVRLRKVLLNVVKLPGVVVEAGTAGRQPGQPAMQTSGDPSSSRLSIIAVFTGIVVLKTPRSCKMYLKDSMP
jgi:hypothetical protein